jgi:hypothetical protein
MNTMVENWFRNNTFSNEEFKNIKELVSIKKKNELKISLGIPVFNTDFRTKKNHVSIFIFERLGWRANQIKTVSYRFSLFFMLRRFLYCMTLKLLI